MEIPGFLFGWIRVVFMGCSRVHGPDRLFVILIADLTYIALELVANQGSSAGTASHHRPARKHLPYLTSHPLISPPFLSHPLLRPIRAKPVRLLETRRVPTLPRPHLNDNPQQEQSRHLPLPHRRGVRPLRERVGVGRGGCPSWLLNRRLRFIRAVMRMEG